MSTHTIRPATEKDVPLILALIREIAEYEKLSHEVIANEETLRRFLFPSPTPPTLRGHAAAARAPAAEVLLGQIDGQVQGYALYFHNFSTFMGRPGIYLEDIFVRPAFRGQGLGRALFAAVARVAAERGCPRMEWAVLDWNTSAIEFYKSLGARAMSEWTLFRLTGDALAAAGRA